MFERLRNLFASRSRAVSTIDDSKGLAMLRAMRAVQAKYDAAQTNEENRRHWANADALSAAACNTLAVRQTLRNRARYERANNCYANGMVRTLAYDVVASGPTLALDVGNVEVSRRIRRAWQQWCNAVGFTEKLLTMRQSRTVDGEAFAMLTTNTAIAHPVQLDVRLVECDSITDPTLTTETEKRIDGITFDDSGNPVTYQMLRRHPGDIGAQSNAKPQNIDAAYMIHWFRADRPGQLRGIPEVTPALPLYAILRRYTLATLSAAEIAALFALFLKTNSAAVDPAEIDEWLSLEINRGAMTTLPDGWDISQLEARQPTTGYDAFISTVLREIARCLDMPFNVAAGDSSKSNFASGRLDHKNYQRSIEVDRQFMRRVVVDRVFRAWLDEAVRVPGLLQGAPPIIDWQWDWYFAPYVWDDPEKEANSRSTLLAHGLTTFARESATVLGMDWQEVMEQQAKCLGMTVEDYQRRLAEKLLAVQGATNQQGAGNANSNAAKSTDAATVGE